MNLSDYIHADISVDLAPLTSSLNTLSMLIASSGTFIHVSSMLLTDVGGRVEGRDDSLLQGHTVTYCC